MKKKPKWLKKLQSLSSEAASLASEKAAEASSHVKAKVKDLDADYGIASRISQAGKKLDSEYKLKNKIETMGSHINKGIDNVRRSESYQEAKKNVGNASHRVRKNIASSIGSYLDESGVSRHYRDVKNKAEKLYGTSRRLLKPYFAPDTPIELLEKTKKELLYLNACILQVSPGNAEKLANDFGKAVASKLAGGASAAAVLTMASTFGTAGTGAAIGSLSGAAATNASLAWVGGWVGGGMAAGAVLTGGVALAVGIGTCRMLSSRKRSFDELSDIEKRIIKSSSFLVAAINDVLQDKNKKMNYQDAENVLNHSLRPLYECLLEHTEEIAGNLDHKDRMAFKYHALDDFKKNVICGFEYFLKEEQKNRRKRYPKFAIAGVIYALITGSAVDDSRESQLVLDALRRMRRDWHNASEADLSEALSHYSPEQLRGVANNVKGIYHELLFVDDYNRSHQDTHAQIFEATNHAGSDVIIRSTETNDIVKEYQLKAVSSDQIIQEHFERYPDIEVLATEETASHSDLASSSGFSNEDLTEQVDTVLSDVSDNTLAGRTGDAAILSGMTAAAMEAKNVISGRRALDEAGINVIKSSGIAAGSTALVALLFS